jgi:hypothetical protein
MFWLVGLLMIGGIVTAVDRAADSDLFDYVGTMVVFAVVPPFLLGLIFQNHLAKIALLTPVLVGALWVLAMVRDDDTLVETAWGATAAAIVCLLVLWQLAPTYYNNGDDNGVAFLAQWDIPPVKLRGDPPYEGKTFDEAVRSAFASRVGTGAWIGLGLAAVGKLFNRA